MDQSESVDDVMVRSVGWVISVYEKDSNGKAAERTALRYNL